MLPIPHSSQAECFSLLSSLSSSRTFSCCNRCCSICFCLPSSRLCSVFTCSSVHRLWVCTTVANTGSRVRLSCRKVSTVCSSRSSFRLLHSTFTCLSSTLSDTYPVELFTFSQLCSCLTDLWLPHAASRQTAASVSKHSFIHCLTLKQGQTLIYSSGSMFPLPFRSGDVSRCPITCRMLYFCCRSFISFFIVFFCSGVRVSVGFPLRSSPPM